MIWALIIIVTGSYAGVNSSQSVTYFETKELCERASSVLTETEILDNTKINAFCVQTKN